VVSQGNVELQAFLASLEGRTSAEENAEREKMGRGDKFAWRVLGIFRNVPRPKL